MATLLVRDVMTACPHTIGVRLTLADAARVMKKYKVRHLPVLEGGALVGVISDRDVQMIASVSELDPTCILVEDAMTQAPWTVDPATPASEVARTMAEKKLGSAVVLDHDKVVGVFTTTDGMRCLADLLGDEKKKKGKSKN